MARNETASARLRSAKIAPVVRHLSHRQRWHWHCHCAQVRWLPRPQLPQPGSGSLRPAIHGGGVIALAFRTAPPQGGRRTEALLDLDAVALHLRWCSLFGQSIERFKVVVATFEESPTGRSIAQGNRGWESASVSRKSPLDPGHPGNLLNFALPKPVSVCFGHPAWPPGPCMRCLGGLAAPGSGPARTLARLAVYDPG